MTHGVTWLPRCDAVVAMRRGRVSEAGSYDDLLNSDGAFAEFIKTYLQETEDLSEEEMTSEGEARIPHTHAHTPHTHTHIVSTGNGGSERGGDDQRG